MRILYSFLLYLLTPFLLLRLWKKGRLLPAYRSRIAERFGAKISDFQAVDIWVHAVSLGEVNAVIPLVEALLKEGKTFCITCMTPTGSEKIRSFFGDRVSHRYLPYDLPVLMKQFYRTIKPKIALIMETELWPNMIHYAKKSNIPLLLVNARISDKAFSQYRKVRFFFKPLLSSFTAILAQSPEDARRYLALGAASTRVECTGNLKFDMKDFAGDLPIFQDLKARWGQERVVLIAASTHKAEEKMLLDALPLLQKSIPNLIFLIAPRHPERFQEVYQLAKNLGFNTGLRSQAETLTPENAVVVLDSLGELGGFFRVSDYAFIGGSLVPVGGHNVLEPISAGIPVFSGKQVQNFKSICEELEAAGALVLVEDAQSLMHGIEKLQADPEAKAEMTAKASGILNANSGALDRYLEKIRSLIPGVEG